MNFTSVWLCLLQESLNGDCPISDSVRHFSSDCNPKEIVKAGYRMEIAPMMVRSTVYGHLGWGIDL